MVSLFTRDVNESNCYQMIQTLCFQKAHDSHQRNDALYGTQAKIRLKFENLH